jgi:hypothetical protein
MRSAIAEGNWAMMERFNNACSRTEPGLARAAKKFLPAMACETVTLAGVSRPFAFSSRLRPEWSVGINRHWTALVDGGSLCLRDTFHLPLFAQVGLKLRKHPKHVQEAFAGCGAGIDRLFSRLQQVRLRIAWMVASSLGAV